MSGDIILPDGTVHLSPEKVIENVRNDISRYLGAISKMFAPGNRITLVVRNPDIANGDLVMTDEEDFSLPIGSILQLEREVLAEKSAAPPSVIL